MNRFTFFIISLCISVSVYAQVYKTVDITAGNLLVSLTPEELLEVTNLTITGTIDARDFKTMRDDMPVLSEIDISGASVIAYSGEEGTFTGFNVYPDNELPYFTFVNPNTGTGKASLIKVKLPVTLTSIGGYAFYDCINLQNISLPVTLTELNDFAFSLCTGLTSLTIPQNVDFYGWYVFYGCSALESITVLSPIPADLSLSLEIFTGVDIASCILFVPYESSALYGSSVIWEDFANIVEMDGFRLSATQVNFQESAGTETVNISANVSWDAETDQNWIEVSPSSFTGNSPLELTVEANTSVTARTATVTISSPGIVSQTIKVTQSGVPVVKDITAGGLFAAFTPEELNSITSLVLTGTIDARDFKTMRDDMPLLAEIDLSGTSVVAYYGSEGTYFGFDSDYPADVIPEMAFYNYDLGVGKTSLVNIVFPSSIRAVLQQAFSFCSGLKAVTIPSLVISLGDQVFSGCSGLKSVTIPQSVSSIGTSAFLGCSNLMSITNYAPVPVDLTYLLDVFYGVNTDACVLKVPYQASPLYSIADKWKDFLNIVEMPGFRLSKTSFLFEESASYGTVDISADVTWNAGSDQSWLTVNPTINTGNSTLELNVEANTSVASRTAYVTISSSGIESQLITVTQLGVIKNIEITAGGLNSALTPDELATISRMVLTGTIDARDFRVMRDEMPELSYIDISGATIVEYNGIEGTLPTVPYSYPANRVPDYAFWNLTDGKIGLKTVILPSSVTAVGDFAFFFCSGLSSFSLPPAVSSIGYYAFFGCSSITSIDIPSSVTAIKEFTFYECSGLTSVNIPSSVLSIGGYAFGFCENLTSVTIPQSVISISESAFYYCTGLTSVISKTLVPVDLTFSPYVFEGVDKHSCTLIVPNGTFALYAAALQWKDFLNIVEFEESTVQLSYKMANPRINGDYFEFDVQVKASQAGSYLWKGDVSFNLNSSTLSTNTADWVAELSLPFTESNSLSNAKYSASVSVAGSTVKIAVNGDENALNEPASGVDFVEVGTSYETILTVGGKISDADGVAGISFNTSGMNGQQLNKTSTAPWFGFYISPNLYEGEFENLYAGRIYSDGTWTQVGGLDWDVAVGTSVYDGNATLSDGFANASNLHIRGLSSLNILPSGRLTVSGATSVEASGGLTIESNATGTGSLITGSAVGTADVNIWVTTGAWHQVAPPVSGQTVSGFLTSPVNISSIATNGANRAMMNYITANNTWSAFYTNATIGSLATGQGYMLRSGADGIVNFSGTISAGTQLVSLNGAGDTGWNLIGNPYTSAIDLNSGAGDFLTTNLASLDPGSAGVYVWNQGAGKYDVVNLATDDDVASVGQAIFVKSVSEGATVLFSPSMQLHSGAQLKSAKTAGPTIKLVAVNAGVKTSAEIKFLEGTSTGLDPGYDAGLFSLGATVSLYTKLVDGKSGNYMLQCLPPAELGNVVIPAGLNSKDGGKVTFSAEMKNIPTGTLVMLEDKLNNTFTDLSTGDYTTTVQTKSATDGRFYLHISSTATAIGTLDKTDNELKVYTVRQEGIRIEGNVSSDAKATLFDMQGRLVFVKNLEGGNLNVIRTSGIKSGIYMLRISEMNQAKGYKISVME